MLGGGGVGLGEPEFGFGLGRFHVCGFGLLPEGGWDVDRLPGELPAAGRGRVEDGVGGFGIGLGFAALLRAVRAVLAKSAALSRKLLWSLCRR